MAEDTSGTQAPFPNPVARRLYPEVAAGGYTRHDTHNDFYLRVNTLLDKDSVVLDYGAGRGAWVDYPMAEIQRWLRDFGKRVAKVVAVDVDPVVMENDTVDERHLIEIGGPLPFADETFDLVLSDYVLEHVSHEDAPKVAAEIGRVLKPGGWLAARTPNKWGAIGVGARLVPNRLHVRVLAKLQPGRQSVDVFPTVYSMNTKRALRRLFPADRFEVAVYAQAGEPAYAGSTVAGWRAAAFVDRITPPQMYPTLMVFVRKLP